MLTQCDGNIGKLFSIRNSAVRNSSNVILNSGSGSITDIHHICISACVKACGIFNNSSNFKQRHSTITTANWPLAYVAPYPAWFRYLCAHQRRTEKQCPPDSNS